MNDIKFDAQKSTFFSMKVEARDDSDATLTNLQTVNSAIIQTAYEHSSISAPHSFSPSRPMPTQVGLV
jgi:hypothetical protein